MHGRLAMTLTTALLGLALTTGGSAPGATSQSSGGKHGPQFISRTPAPQGSSVTPTTGLAPGRHGHHGLPETHIHRASHHVRLAPDNNEHGARGQIYLKRLGQQTQVSILARGLEAGQNYQLLVDSAANCAAGNQQVIATLNQNSEHRHGRVDLSRGSIRSLGLRNNGGQIVACGSVHHHTHL